MRDFRDAFFDSAISGEELARIALIESTQAYHPKDIESLCNAALCFGIQQFGALDMATYNQERTAKQLSDALNDVVAAFK